MSVMTTRVGIIGQCQFCHRLVAIDMRPVNDVDVSVARSFAQMRKEAVANMEAALVSNPVSENGDVGMDEEPGCSGTQGEKQVSVEEKAEVYENPLKKITGTIMRLVREEFLRSPAQDEESSEVSSANAEVIMTMLAEEERIVDKIRSQAAKRKAKK